MRKNAGATGGWKRVAIFWVYAGSKATFVHALDNRPRESAKMALSLAGNNAPPALNVLDRPAKSRAPRALGRR